MNGNGNGNGNGHRKVKAEDGMCVCHHGMGCYTCSRWGMLRAFIAFVILTVVFFAGVKIGELKGYIHAARYGAQGYYGKQRMMQPMQLREILPPGEAQLPVPTSTTSTR